MNRNKMISALGVMLLCSSHAFSQVDTLTLGKAIGEALATHPTVLQAQEAIAVAETKITMAKSGYLPTAEASGKFSVIGPVSEIPFGSQRFQMSPRTPYSASVSVNQLIYDFGRTKSDDAVAVENRNIATVSLEQTKQKLSQAVIGTYYAILYLQNAKDIKDEQLRTLNSHLDFVVKKKATGSATEYEILTTKVRIGNVESQKTDIATALMIQQSVMSSLLGREVGSTFRVGNGEAAVEPMMPVDSLYSQAFSNRNEMKIAQERVKLSELSQVVAKKQNSPTISAFASGGFQNGYPLYLEDPRMNFAVGLALKVPIFQGFWVKNSVVLARSATRSSQLEAELTRRNVSNEVTDARLSVESALTKVHQLELQEQQAAKALRLAEVSFKAGSITNLDLLDATTSLSESQLNLLKAKIDYTTSIYKLRVALGQNLY